MTVMPYGVMAGSACHLVVRDVYTVKQFHRFVQGIFHGAFMTRVARVGFDPAITPNDPLVAVLAWNAPVDVCAVFELPFRNCHGAQVGRIMAKGTLCRSRAVPFIFEVADKAGVLYHGNVVTHGDPRVTGRAA
jgi:hypothetical protein